MGNQSHKHTESLEDLASQADKRASNNTLPEEQISAGETTSDPAQPSSASVEDVTTSPDQDSDSYSDSDQEEESRSDRSKFRNILEAGRNLTEDASDKLVFLTELCETLSFCDDLSVTSQIAGELSPSLVRLSREELITDVSLLAVRAMTYLCDLYPRSSEFLVRDDAVSVLCQKLMAIQDMDVAEQCLRGLEKISQEQPLPCLQGGAITAVLSYLDFFSTTTQRVAVSTVMNICKKLPSEPTSPFMDAVPILSNLLQYEDVKVVEIAAECLIRITCRVRRNPELLDQLCSHGIIYPIFDLFSSTNRTSLPEPIYNGLLGLLATLSSGSFSAFKVLFELNISSVLKGILSSLNVSHEAFSSHMIDSQSNKIHGALNLLDQLIPSLIVDLNSSKLSEKETYLCQNTELLKNLGTDNLPLLIKVANSGATTYICYGSLSIIRKLIHWCEPDTLIDLLMSANISSFLASVLTRKDQHVLLIALQTSDSILKKLPNVFSNSFVKEGVFFSMEALLKLPRVTPEVSSQSKEPEKKDSAVSRCLCHSFGPKRSSCKLEKDFPIHKLAKRIKTAHVPTDSLSSGETSSSKVLRDLTALSKILSDMANTSGQDEEDSGQYCGILQKIIDKLGGENEDSISTFEFLESGIVSSLIDFLTFGRSLRDEDGDGFSPGKRYEVFARLFLPSRDSPPLENLVRKLQQALSATETFPSFLNSASKMKESSGYQSGQSSTRLPFLRVRFVRAEGETSLKDFYKGGYVGVNPLSTVTEIKALLWPKVNAETEQVEEEAEETESEESDDSMSNDEDDNEESPESDSPPKLLFFLDGQQLNSQWTLYQAILEKLMKEEDESQKIWWSQGHTFTYRRSSEEEEKEEEEEEKKTENDQISSLLRNKPVIEEILTLLTLLNYTNELSFSTATTDKIRDFAEEKLDDLNALRVNSIEPFVARTEFVNSKLTEKIEMQIRDPMAVSLEGMPLWCGQLVSSIPIVVGFESKNKYFRLSSFGSSSRFHVQDNAHYSDGEIRRKFTASRSSILESAAMIMQAIEGQKVSLEIKYVDEVGTGLGPTLEFYTLVSREFQRTGMQLWRDDFGSAEFVTNPLGLFPRPWSSSEEKVRGIEFAEVTNKFLLLGQIVAKALQDGRVLDISLSKAFYKLMLGQELCLFDIVSFDPGLARILVEFKALIDRKLYLETKKKISLIEYDSWFRDTKIEDLCLDFTLPGYPEFLLNSELKDETVTMSNLDEYFWLVLDATLKSGISKQFEAFKSGFNQIFPIENLRVFNEEELERVLSGEQGTWDVTELIDNVKIDHGYTSSSTPIIHLFEIIREFDANDRRAFLQFVTGAPRLPLGGFKSLSPNLTIVRKIGTNGSVDSDLPSVMTCANYLKLPPYSTKETMRAKMIYAITEGQGSFDLS